MDAAVDSPETTDWTATIQQAWSGAMARTAAWTHNARLNLAGTGSTSFRSWRGRPSEGAVVVEAADRRDSTAVRVLAMDRPGFGPKDPFIERADRGGADGAMGAVTSFSK